MSKQELHSTLANLPSCPGVYKMKDETGRILYVGKAKCLKNRVRSYFHESAKHSRRTQKLVEQIADIEWIEVGSDLEAYMLETNLIKELRPKYNILMKDDKNFCYIKITKEVFPRIKVVRKRLKDGALYIGPKTSAGRVKKTLSLLQKLFKYRSCDLGMVWNEKVQVTKKTIAYPCLDYHIKRCAGPCISEITPEEYGKSIDKIVHFLKGNTKEIENTLKAEMMQHVESKSFEKAALIRDKLLAIEELHGKQTVSMAQFQDMDVVAFIFAHGKAFVNLFQVRDGKLINQENFSAEAPAYEEGEELDSPEVMEQILHDYYEKTNEIPAEILCSVELQEDNFFIDWIESKAGRKVKVRVPQKGEKAELIRISLKNAQSYLKQEQVRWMNSSSRDIDAVNELQKVLDLEKAPARIECYDISHLGGTNTVASMVVFQNGRPNKMHYRKFRLKSIEEGEIDDFKSMNEVLGRRLSYLLKNPPGIKFRKASKSTLKKLNQILEEWRGEEQSVDDPEGYTLVMREKQVIGVIKIKHSKDVALLESLYLTPEERGQNLGKKFIQHNCKKNKLKRLYLVTPESKVEYYKHIGFEEIKNFPKQFQSDKKGLTMALDPNQFKDESFAKKPDLIVIDGGKGQLSSAHKALTELGLEIPMISLAKREEEIFTPGKSMPILTPKDGAASILLQSLRNEAHRFAIQFQKQSRRAELRASKLDSIPGVGEQTKLKLLKKFASVDVIAGLTKEELSKEVGPALAQKIKEAL